MRTDTCTFVKRTARQLRAEGLSVATAKSHAEQLAGELRHNGIRTISDSAHARISINDDDQRTCIVHEGLVVVQVCASHNKPLFSVEPTARQLEIYETMRGLRGDLYSAISDAHHDGVADIYESDPVALLNARYDALRDESYAENRFAPGSIIDPNSAAMFSDLYKEIYGSRPRGYRRYEEIREFLANPPKSLGEYYDEAA